MAGKLFSPGDVSIRDPKSNQQMKGNIYNPPRYSQMGGLSSAKKANTYSAGMNVVPPSSTIRKHPAE